VTNSGLVALCSLLSRTASDKRPVLSRWPAGSAAQALMMTARTYADLPPSRPVDTVHHYPFLIDLLAPSVKAAIWEDGIHIS
jgi:hypothetical protein